MSQAITTAADTWNVDRGLAHTIAALESSGRPALRDQNPDGKLSKYMGLYQLDKSEFDKWGQGNIFNAHDNAMAAMAKLRAESDEFKATYGREPDATDIYMQHQQGVGGYAMHMKNPDEPAWLNMAQTAEGRQRGEGWARRAIWWNVPKRFQAMFEDVDSITSRDFVEMWRNIIQTKGKVGEFRDNVDISEETPDSLPTPAPIRDERVGFVDIPDGIGKTLDEIVNRETTDLLVKPRAVSKPLKDRLKNREESNMIEDRRGDYSFTDKEIRKMFPGAMSEQQMEHLKGYRDVLDQLWESAGPEYKVKYQNNKEAFVKEKMEALEDRFKEDNAYDPFDSVVEKITKEVEKPKIPEPPKPRPKKKK